MGYIDLGVWCSNYVGFYLISMLKNKKVNFHSGTDNKISLAAFLPCLRILLKKVVIIKV